VSPCIFVQIWGCTTCVLPSLASARIWRQGHRAPCPDKQVNLSARCRWVPLVWRSNGQPNAPVPNPEPAVLAAEGAR
jgi:hypothetical protein